MQAVCVHNKGMRVEDETYITVTPCEGTLNCFRTAAADLQSVTKQPQLICSAWTAEVF